MYMYMDTNVQTRCITHSNSNMKIKPVMTDTNLKFNFFLDFSVFVVSSHLALREFASQVILQYKLTINSLNYQSYNHTIHRNDCLWFIQSCMRDGHVPDHQRSLNKCSQISLSRLVYKLFTGESNVIRYISNFQQNLLLLLQSATRNDSISYSAGLFF